MGVPAWQSEAPKGVMSVGGLSEPPKVLLLPQDLRLASRCLHSSPSSISNLQRALLSPPHLLRTLCVNSGCLATRGPEEPVSTAATFW